MVECLLSSMHAHNLPHSETCTIFRTAQQTRRKLPNDQQIRTAADRTHLQLSRHAYKGVWVQQSTDPPALLYRETQYSPCPCTSSQIQIDLHKHAQPPSQHPILHSLDSISYAQRPCRRNAILYLYIISHPRPCFSYALVCLPAHTSRGRDCLVRNLAVVDCLGQWLDKLASRTENLQLVVLGGAHHQPGVVLVPVKVADTVGEATMHE